MIQYSWYLSSVLPQEEDGQSSTLFLAVHMTYALVPDYNQELHLKPLIEISLPMLAEW